MKVKLIWLKSWFVLLVIILSNTLQAVEKKGDMPSQKANSSVQATMKSSDGKTVAIKLTFKEKMNLIKEIKKESKKAGIKKKSGTPMVILYILAIILPPLAVGIFTDWGEPTLWNLLFTICFWIPGVVHAFYILLK